MRGRGRTGRVCAAGCRAERALRVCRTLRVRRAVWAARVWLVLFVVLAALPAIEIRAQTVSGAAGTEGSDRQERIQDGRTEEDAEREYLDHWLDELDFTGLDELLEREMFPKEPGRLRFSGLVRAFLEDGISGFDYGSLADWLTDALFYELDAHRKLLLEAVLLAVAFSVLKNFSGGFRSAYISEISFLFIYCVLAVLLMQSFEVYSGIAEEALLQSTDFMKALVPTLCVSMVFSGGPETSAGFYQLAFLVIYLVQWMFLYLLLPLIRVYVVMELFNHFFEDERFENLTELLRNGIDWGMKSTGIAVLGLNVVQGLIAPVKDRLTAGTFFRAASVIPGVGNVINGVGELLIGSGMLIKNCVGVAALVVLAVLVLVPVIKIFCMSVLYKLAAVLVEPVSDKRLAGCLKGMSEGGFLYMKLVVYCAALMILTVALTTAASGILN